MSVDLLFGLENIAFSECQQKNDAALFAPFSLSDSAPESRSLSDQYVSPRYGNGTPSARKLEHVEAVTHVALDFDGLDDPTFESVFERLTHYRCVAWSTWSWGLPSKPGWRFRAVFALTTEVPAGSWGMVFKRLLGAFPEADAKCSDASRIMFLPSHRPGAQHWRYAFRGTPIDPDELPVAPLRVDSNTAPIPEILLQRLVKKWWRASDVRKARLADALKKALDGVPFAEQGAKDDATFELVCEIVREIANVEPSAIVATLAPSLQLMGAGVGYLTRDLPAKIERAKRYLDESSESEAALDVPAPSMHDPRLLGFLKSLRSEDPIRSLVLQRDGEYWVLTSSAEHGFQYVQCRREGLARQCADKWSGLGVKLIVSSAEGKTRRMKSEEIVETYGTPIEDAVSSFNADQPFIRRSGARRELVMPAARRRDLEPLYSEDIDHWLTLLGGANNEVLKDWLALAPDTTKPLAALVLTDAPGTGKSLLTIALARIWTTHGPCVLERVLGGFNDDLNRTPVVVAEEQLPKDFRGQVRSAEIRDFVQQGHHKIDKKFAHLSMLEGFARIVLTSNGNQALDFGSEALTPADLAAIQARLLVIKTHESAAQYLTRCDCQAWLEQDLITRHLLWLAANREVKHTGRFGVDTGETFSSAFVHAQGTRSGLVEWVVKYILRPQLINARTRLDSTSIGIRLADIETYWGIYLTSPKPRTDRLAVASRVFAGSGDGWLQVSVGDIVQWCASANYCSQEEILQAFVGLSSAENKGLSVVK